MKELMNTRLHTYPIDGLCARCDWMVAGEELKKIKQTDSPCLIFVSTAFVRKGKLSVPYFANNVLPVIKNDFTLIIASEDATFPYDIGDVRMKYFVMCQNEIAKILENQYVKRIYVENLDSLHEKCYPIPLGHLKHNSLYCEYEKMCNESHPINFDAKVIQVFCCHINRDGPQWRKRAIVKNLAENEWSRFTTYKSELDEVTFLSNLIQSKFCLCAQGGGYDPSPKCWQAIICGAIPIIEHSPLDWAYERLPVVFVDSWDVNTINEKQLSEWEQQLRPYYCEKDKRDKVMEMMRLDYWHMIIANHNDKYDSIAALSENMRIAKEGHIYCEYGSEKIRQNVSNLFCKAFLNGNTIVVPANTSFNSIFGDPCAGIEKTLTVTLDTGVHAVTIKFTEHLEKTFSVSLT